MDYRSLYLHFECGVWLYNCGAVKDMKQDFLETVAVSKAITPRVYTQETKKYKSLAGMVLRVLAPLM